MTRLATATPISPFEHQFEDQPTLEQAIMQAVAYADIFDYALTVEDIHRYMVGVAAPLAAVRQALASPCLATQFDQHDGLVALAGRSAIMATRRRRAQLAAQMWPHAWHYGQLLARLPFVRMVAVTGALAVDNVEPGADIDYLIITVPGRLWLCRLLTIGLVRLARLRGDIICPNYFLSERALALRERDLYTAHELAQMVPIAGYHTYQAIRQHNRWAEAWLPNAPGAPPRAGARQHDQPQPVLAEWLLRGRLGSRLEGWEMARKLQKFSRRDRSDEVAFSPDWCKGHFDGHAQRVLAAFAARLRALESGTAPIRHASDVDGRR